MQEKKKMKGRRRCDATYTIDSTITLNIRIPTHSHTYNDSSDNYKFTSHLHQSYFFVIFFYFYISLQFLFVLIISRVLFGSFSERVPTKMAAKPLWNWENQVSKYKKKYATKIVSWAEVKFVMHFQYNRNENDSRVMRHKKAEGFRGQLSLIKICTFTPSRLRMVF